MEGERAQRRRRARSGTALAFGGLLALAAAAAHGETEPGKARPPVVTLTLADSTPVIGVTGETQLRIEVADPPTSPMPPPRVLCSVGQVEDLGRDGPASFTARYILPAGRFPQPAIIVAEFATARGFVRGFAPVRLRAAATPALHTDPGAQVTLHVDDRDFGPQTAPANGEVHIPVVVPPGVEFATARSVNQHGKATEQILDLRVPYSQRLLFVAPAALAAGAIGEVVVYAVDASGRPANATALVMRALGGRVQPLGSMMPGEARFLVTAPKVLRERHLRIEAQLKGQSTTRIASRIPLEPAKAAGLSLEPEAPHLARDGKSGLRVFVNAEDAYGNPIKADHADVLVDGQRAKIVADDQGQPLIVVPPRPAGPARQVVVEGVLDYAHTLRTIPIGVAGPRSAFGSGGPAPRYTLTPSVGVLWNLGRQAGAMVQVEAVAYRSTRHPDFGLGLSLGLVQSWFDADSAAAVTRTSLTTVPVLFEIHERWSARQAFFALGAGAGFALSFAQLHSQGVTVSGHGYGAALQAAAEVGATLGEAQLVLSLRYLAVYLSELSSRDEITGNAAGAVASIGYRLGW